MFGGRKRPIADFSEFLQQLLSYVSTTDTKKDQRSQTTGPLEGWATVLVGLVEVTTITDRLRRHCVDIKITT